MLTSEQLSDAGVAGLCSAGRALALRLAGRGVRVSLLDSSAASVEAFVTQNAGTRGGLVGYTDREDFIESLREPRRAVVFETGNDRLAIVLRLSWQEPDCLLECPVHDDAVSSGDLEQIEMALLFQLA
jgi:6-phosphogluconate dehydrogenase